MNHPAAADKVGTSRGISSPLVAGNHVISAQNRSNILRLLQFVSVLMPLASSLCHQLYLDIEFVNLMDDGVICFVSFAAWIVLDLGQCD